MQSHTGISVTFGNHQDQLQADDVMGPVLWTKHFLEEQGYD